MRFCFLISLIFILSNCTPKQNKRDNDCITVNFERAVTKKIKLNDIAGSLEFTFLEFDKQNLVGKILNYKITNQYILIVDQQQKLFVFKKDGKLVSVIHNIGKGPSEYINIEDFTIDSKEQFITILDPSNGKILQYNILGSYINEYPIAYNHAAHISSLIDNHYCVYQSARFSEKYFNIHILDSKFQTLNSIKDPGGIYLKKSPYMFDVNWYNYNNNTYYKEVMVDTIFKINDNHISEPYIRLDLGKRKMPNKYYTNTKAFQKGIHKFYQMGEIVESQKYIFFRIFLDQKKKHFLYKKGKTQLLFNLEAEALPNNQELDINFWPEYIDNNEIMYRFIDPTILYEKIKSNPKASAIKHLIESNDNPVLLSVKLLNNEMQISN